MVCFLLAAPHTSAAPKRGDAGYVSAYKHSFFIIVQGPGKCKRFLGRDALQAGASWRDEAIFLLATLRGGAVAAKPPSYGSSAIFPVRNLMKYLAAMGREFLSLITRPIFRVTAGFNGLMAT